MNLYVKNRVVRWNKLLFLLHFGYSQVHLPDKNNLKASLIGVIVLFVSVIQNANALQLNSDSTLATAGYFQLQWSGNSKIFILQESGKPDFDSYNTIYTGTDLARVMSGKPNGDYFYRIVDNSSQSNIVKVTVKHHSIGYASLFFIAGAIVFILTLIFIIKGNKQQFN